eukprot:5546994-Prymnesium_polylepis.2
MEYNPSMIAAYSTKDGGKIAHLGWLTGWGAFGELPQSPSRPEHNTPQRVKQAHRASLLARAAASACEFSFRLASCGEARIANCASRARQRLTVKQHEEHRDGVHGGDQKKSPHTPLLHVRPVQFDHVRKEPYPKVSGPHRRADCKVSEWGDQQAPWPRQIHRPADPVELRHRELVVEVTRRGEAR